MANLAAEGPLAWIAAGHGTRRCAGFADPSRFGTRFLTGAKIKGMTSADAAIARLESAQALLDQVASDNDRLDQALEAITSSAARARELQEWYHESAETDVAAVLAERPDAVTPPVGNEDAVWEALSERYNRILRILREVADEVTAELDSIC